MMGFVREITDAPQRNWNRDEAYYPKQKRAVVELDRGDRVQVDYDPRLHVGSRVGLLYSGCGYFVDEILLF